MNINYTKCLAYIKNKGCQCSRNRKENEEFCGTHQKSINVINITKITLTQPEQPKQPTQPEQLTHINKQEIMRIQRAYRRYIFRRIHGKCVFNRRLSNNTEEISTCELIYDIPVNNFFSFLDKNDNKYYSFDIRSLYSMYKIAKSENKPLKNPYNLYDIKLDIIRDIEFAFRLNKNLEYTPPKLSMEQKLEFDVFDLFQEINKLGNYTDYKWYMNLSLEQLYKLYYWLKDIWDYSYQGSYQERCSIIPPYGKVFLDGESTIRILKNIKIVRKRIYDEVKLLVCSGINLDAKRLGTWLFLSALVKVSPEAALALPALAEQIMN